MQFVRIGGVTLHYEAQASVDDRPAIVFINSLGTDLRIWDGVRAALPEAWPTLAYDTRGHGLSDFAPSPGGVDDHVTDLSGLMSHLGIDRAVLCGVSLGGLIAQGLYRRHRDRVAALLLSNTGLAIGTQAFWNTRIAEVRAGGIAGVADKVLPRWFSSAFLDSGAPAISAYTNMLVRQSAEGYEGACAALRDADFTADAGAIAVPTLCVAGDGDLATPPSLVEALAAAIPGAHYRLIEEAGHLPMIERPEHFAALLADLVSSLPRGGL